MQKLNFGCGRDIKNGWDNADIQKGEKVINFDFNSYPYSKLKDNTYDYILIKQVLILINEADKCLNELWKKAKKNAQMEIIVPYFNNKGASNDIQGKHYFTDSTFKVFIACQPCKIKKQKKFEIIKLKLMPTKIGKFLPKKLRETLSIFVGGFISEIYIKLRVIK